MPSRRWVIFIVGAVTLTLLIVVLAIRFPEVLDNQDSQIKLVHATLVLSVFLVPSLFYRRIKAGTAVKAMAIWASIGFVLFVGYAFRDEASYFFNRLAGELIPGTAQMTGASMQVRMGRDGHFAVEADVDGTRVRFLVDTGASELVLSPADAKRLGFDLNKLNYSKIFSTANGQVKGAPVKLGQVSIGSIQMQNVSASVNGAAMNRSLLGMSFLSRLSKFEMDGNSLTLTP